MSVHFVMKRAIGGKIVQRLKRDGKKPVAENIVCKDEDSNYSLSITPAT